MREGKGGVWGIQACDTQFIRREGCTYAASAGTPSAPAVTPSAHGYLTPLPVRCAPHVRRVSQAGVCAHVLCTVLCAVLCTVVCTVLCAVLCTVLHGLQRGVCACRHPSR